MDELIEKVENTLEERDIRIPENYDIKNILVDYDSIEITDDVFEDIISKFKKKYIFNESEIENTNSKYEKLGLGDIFFKKQNLYI